jgi:hypothetical protein
MNSIRASRDGVGLLGFSLLLMITMVGWVCALPSEDEEEDKASEKKDVSNVIEPIRSAAPPLFSIVPRFRILHLILLVVS